MFRPLLLLLALAVTVWFALGVRQAIDTQRAAAIVSGSAPLSLTQVDRALALLRGAHTLNPDREVDILKGETLLEHGDQRAARNVLTGVARAEPMNLEAWVALGRTSRGDPALLLRVLKSVRALEPLLPPQR